MPGTMLGNFTMAELLQMMLMVQTAILSVVIVILWRLTRIYNYRIGMFEREMQDVPSEKKPEVENV
jgi:hypothetical protein